MNLRRCAWRVRTASPSYIDQIADVGTSTSMKSYGGVNIKNQSVINKLLEFAVNKTQFQVTNNLMGGDPWERTTKTFTMVYSFGSEGPFRYYSCKEGKTAQFE